MGFLLGRFSCLRAATSFAEQRCAPRAGKGSQWNEQYSEYCAKAGRKTARRPRDSPLGRAQYPELARIDSRFGAPRWLKANG